MGDRAIITTKQNYENNGVGIYLHWNGDIGSVRAFLKYAQLRRFRTGNQFDYGLARLVQVIANYFGGNLSIGIDVLSNLAEAFDNGTYIIDDGFNIVERIDAPEDDEDNEDDDQLMEMVRDIDRAQPAKSRIFDADGELDAEKVKNMA